MAKVFVLDAKKRPLPPCRTATARLLLRDGNAAVFRRYPFTIILKRAVPNNQCARRSLRIDPGSKTTGLAIVNESNQEIEFAFEVHHRGKAIKKALTTRSGFRRSRRTRKLRYRPARWRNRKRAVAMLTENGTWQYKRVKADEAAEGYGEGKGWVAPSLMSRVHNIATWVQRLQKLCPISSLVLENVKFDTQLLKDPNISGVEYQQGTLHGYEVKEYLLEKYGRKCAYCDVKDVPLEREHIVPKSLGGTNRIDNLTLACRPCNEEKGALLPDEIPNERLQKKVRQAMRDAKKPLKGAAAVNTIRWKIYETLTSTGLPVQCVSGGQTKFNRVRAGLPKTHYYDAACTSSQPKPTRGLTVLHIKALGYGQRDLFKFRSPFSLKNLRKHLDEPFNYGERKRISRDGFLKGDQVVVKKRSGNTYVGWVNCFNNDKQRNVRVTYTLEGKRAVAKTSELHRIQRRDGYGYFYKAAAPAGTETTPKQGPQVPERKCFIPEQLTLAF